MTRIERTTDPAFLDRMRKLVRYSGSVMLAVGLLWLSCTVSPPPAAYAQSMADYTALPPFVSENAVPPNVLLLLDNSGSMNSSAYTDTFDPAKEYFGLFDSLECYSYGTNKFQPDPSSNPASPGTCTNGSYEWSGNLLNYVSMRRIDIVKWVMMGGTCSVGGRDAMGDCRQLIGQNTFDNGTCCRDFTQSLTTAQATGRIPASIMPSGTNVYFHSMGSVASLKGAFCVDDESTQQTSSDCNDGGTYAETKWQIRVDLFENATGVIQQVGGKARFGLMEFKGSGDGGKVLSDVGSDVQDMITGIEATTPATWTPLAESLYEATRYFAQIPPAYNNSDYSHNVVNRDPYYFKQPQWVANSQYVPCCRSFVIVFTDGEPTQDQNIPAAIRDYADSVHGAHCTGAGCSGHRTDYANNGSHYLDDVAYYAHTTDLRQATLPVLGEAGKDLSGEQNLTIYTFFAFGSGSTILQDAAKAGGFEDRNGNNLPDQPQEWDRVNNYTGAQGADGLPDSYFESENAADLRERLLATITSILQRSSSGTSASVLASSTSGEGALYQAYFFPSQFEGLNEVKWLGHVQGLFLDSFGNVREDTDGDGKLVYENDHIIQTRLETTTNTVKADRFKDDNGDGKADTVTPFESVGLKEVISIWEGGEQLALQAASARTLLTWVDSDQDGVVDSGERIAFDTTNAATLAPYLRAGAAPFTADNMINFIRGEQVPGLRDRQVTVNGSLNVWKLGDPIHSTPVIVGTPQERYDVIYGDASYTDYFLKYKNRRQVAYVGANDGMLHAFNAGFYHPGDDISTTTAVEHGWFTTAPSDNSSGVALGTELWGFIPQELLPQLEWLTRGDYTHVYYVDLKPKVTDARIFAADPTHPNGWGTILIGGFRMGGSCQACAAGTGAPPMTVNIGGTDRTFYSAYFVLDITDPEQNPTLLWVFSDPDLGLSMSRPVIARANPSSLTKTDNTFAKWVMLVGSGPTGYGGSSTQDSKVFAIDLKAGPIDPGTGISLVTTFATSDSNAFMGDLVTLDGDLDFRTDVAYGGDVIASGGTPTWTGKMYRLSTADGNTNLALWGVSAGIDRAASVLLGSFPANGSTPVGPIVAAPTVTVDDTSKVWLFFGSGRYFSTLDVGNTDTQHFFGVKDPVISHTCVEAGATDCEQQDLLDVSGVTVCVVCTSGTDQVSGIAGVTTLKGSTPSTLQGLIQGMDGWFTTLPTSGERLVVSPTILGGTVFFPTFVPTDDLCVSSGTGFVYALFYLTGSAYTESSIGAEQDLSGNTNVRRSMEISSAGLASQMAVHIGGQGSGGGGSLTGGGCAGRVTGFIQTSTGSLSQFCAKPALSGWSRYVSWLLRRL